MPTFRFDATCDLKVQHEVLFKFCSVVLHTSQNIVLLCLVFLPLLVFSDQLMPKRSTANFLFFAFFCLSVLSPV